MTSELDYEYTLVDYCYNDNTFNLKVDDNIRMITVDDREAFVSCAHEQIKYRPPLSVLFDVFVNRGQGQILAVFDSDRIVGYLSFTAISENVYDVDYVYVIPELRQRGIVKNLAAAYATYAKTRGYAAYWSNAKNEASERTAISCGFTVVRRVNKYNFWNF